MRTASVTRAMHPKVSSEAEATIAQVVTAAGWAGRSAARGTDNNCHLALRLADAPSSKTVVNAPFADYFFPQKLENYGGKLRWGPPYRGLFCKRDNNLEARTRIESMCTVLQFARWEAVHRRRPGSGRTCAIMPSMVDSSVRSAPACWRQAP